MAARLGCDDPETDPSERRTYRLSAEQRRSISKQQALMKRKEEGDESMALFFLSHTYTLSLHCTSLYLHGDNRCRLLGRGRAQLWSLWLSNGPNMKEMHTVVFTCEVVDFVRAFICMHLLRPSRVL